MLFPVVCTCGRSIGDLHPIYTVLRQQVIDAELKKIGRNIDPDQTQLATDFHPQLGEILDNLGIELDCCRVRFLTNVEFNDLY